MHTFRLYTALSFLLCSSLVWAQDSISVTYFAGDIPTSFSGYSDACNGPSTTLSVPLPAGDNYEVTNVRIEYDMTALNNGFMEHQRSKVRCANTDLEETEVSGEGASQGTMVYSRETSIANGLYPGQTNIEFEMRARRTFEDIPGCNTTVNRVNAGTWTITVFIGAEVQSDVWVTQEGDVGIGTLDPQNRLHIFSNGSDGDAMIENTDPTLYVNKRNGGTAGGITFLNEGVERGHITHRGDQSLYLTASADASRPDLVATSLGRIGGLAILVQGLFYIALHWMSRETDYLDKELSIQA